MKNIFLFHTTYDIITDIYILNRGNSNFGIGGGVDSGRSVRSQPPVTSFIRDYSPVDQILEFNQTADFVFMVQLVLRCIFLF